MQDTEQLGFIFRAQPRFILQSVGFREILFLIHRQFFCFHSVFCDKSLGFLSNLLDIRRSFEHVVSRALLQIFLNRRETFSGIFSFSRSDFAVFEIF